MSLLSASVTLEADVIVDSSKLIAALTEETKNLHFPLLKQTKPQTFEQKLHFGVSFSVTFHHTVTQTQYMIHIPIGTLFIWEL